jgi:hypothetical protein
MERVYYLIKDTSIFSIIYDLRVLRSLLNWYAVSMPITEEVMFKEIVKGKYYPMDSTTGFKGFKTFADIRDEIKIVEQEANGEVVAFQSEGIYNSVENDPVAGVKKIILKMDAERTNAVINAMRIVAKAVIEEEFDRRFMELDTSSQMEYMSFELQYEEALMYIEDNNADVPLLQALAETREISTGEMANKVISARNLYKQKITTLLKRMTEVKGKFKTANSIRDLNRLYEDCFNIAMPESQAVDEGRVVDFRRVIPVGIGLRF